MNNDHLNHYVPLFFRREMERSFYEKIARQARFEALREDPLFLKNPIKHPGLFSDHGPVHVRDVAARCLEVIDRVNGLLLPLRKGFDLEFLKSFTVHLAYLHDIGMVDFSTYGRFIHPEFAAQWVFSNAFDGLLDNLWSENSGNIPWRLIHLFTDTFSENTLTAREEYGKQVFREMLSLSVAHSKSKFPVDVLNDSVLIRKHMLWIVSHPLKRIYLEQMIKKLERNLDDPDPRFAKDGKREKELDQFRRKLGQMPATEGPVYRFYDDPPQNAFNWLVSDSPGIKRMVMTMVDGIRCLRAADALRQRGTTLRTSAGYEIFVDQTSGHAIYALRGHEKQELFLLEGKKALNAGEANVASSEIDREGNLRISFHRGAFRKPKATRRAVKNAMVVVEDIQADVMESFLRHKNENPDLFPVGPRKHQSDMKLVLEDLEDNPDFVPQVIQALTNRLPHLASHLEIGVSLQGDLEEVERYLKGIPFDDLETDEIRQEWRQQIALTGLYGHILDSEEAFRHVRQIRVHPGDYLIRAGSAAGFVYIPSCDGLDVLPLGGYRHQPAAAWLPLGNTGVVRGADRNAEVRASREALLMAIPRQVYMTHWHWPVPGKTLANKWKDAYENN